MSGYIIAIIDRHAPKTNNTAHWWSQRGHTKRTKKNAKHSNSLREY